MQEEEFDVIVPDIRIPGMDGTELLYTAKVKFRRVVKIILSGYPEKPFPSLY
jgi:YesN/AraC family two-component response regulator